MYRDSTLVVARDPGECRMEIDSLMSMRLPLGVMKTFCN